MSLLDLILAQKGILITAGLALLLLAAAIILSIVSQVRQFVATYAKRRALRAIQAATQAKRQSASETETPDRVTGDQPPVPVNNPNDKAVLPGNLPGSTDAPAAAGATPASGLLSPEDILNQALTATDDQQAGATLDGVPSEVQSILSSVFGDDEMASRNETLLGGIEPITIEHLLVLTNLVAKQLRSPSGNQSHD